VPGSCEPSKSTYKALDFTLFINDMSAWQVLHALGVLDDLLHHQEPARAITFASPSFQTLFSVPDSIVCSGPLNPTTPLLNAVRRVSYQHLPYIWQVWLTRVAYQQLSNVLLETALPRQSSAPPITQCDSSVAQCLLPPH